MSPQPCFVNYHRLAMAVGLQLACSVCILTASHACSLQHQAPLFNPSAPALCLPASRPCRLVDGGDVFAKISELDGMVEFLDSPETYNTGEQSLSVLLVLPGCCLPMP